LRGMHGSWFATHRYREQLRLAGELSGFAEDGWTKKGDRLKNVLNATIDSAMKPRGVRIYYRREIPASDTWDLGLLFSTEDEYRAALEQVRARFCCS
jgi:hypothetical protein